MKNTLLFLAIMISNYATSQIIYSPCTAPDSILAKYTDDADRLALRRIYSNNMTYTDSIDIPPSFSDTILKALIAVYNATSLPARDTVTTMFNIHSFPDIVMNNFYIMADSNLSWMHQLHNGNQTTGNSTVDTVISKYNFTIDKYYATPYSLYHTVVLVTNHNYNLVALTTIFDTISGIAYAEPNGMCCDGNNISSSTYPNYIELIYSYGWGDCPSGCTGRRYWKFQVNYNCLVTYTGSYGALIPVYGTSEICIKSVSVSPNPFNKTIIITGFTPIYSYSISNIIGQKLVQGRSASGNLTNLDKLTSGIYFLTLQSENKIATFKIIKE